MKITSKNLKEMENLVQKANHNYYAESNSIMSDREYDELVRAIQDYYKENNIENKGPTAKVGSSLSDNRFKKVEHKTPMLSLANTYSVDEIKDWITKFDDKEWVAEQKLDGISCSLIYENGVLVRGLTRGDGKVGEDITASIMCIDDIPKRLSKPLNIEVRGELLIPKIIFAIINFDRTANNLRPFATSRNLVSGTIRTLDTEVVKSRQLAFRAYYILGGEDRYQAKILETLTDLGFKIPISKLINDISEADLNSILDELNDKNFAFDTDGVVFKVNDTEKWKESTAKVPKWAFAYKYPTEEVKTKLKEVIWQVGRTGKITPVGILEPVMISGTMVSRATLNNPNYLKDLDLKLNDTVVIAKAAEIIPQILYPVLSERDESARDIEIPKLCPDCRSKLEMNGENLFCRNPKCRSKVEASLVYFADRQHMNIVGLGERTVSVLFKNELIETFSDIYKLKDKVDRLLSLEGFDKIKVSKLLESIEDSKKQPFNKLLAAIQLPGVGNVTANDIALAFESWEVMRVSTVEDFRTIKGINNIAVAIVNAIKDIDSEMAELERLGLPMKMKMTKNLIPVAITGSFAISRADLGHRLSLIGFDLGSLTSKSMALIIGDKPSQDKINKAMSSNIPLIDSSKLTEYSNTKFKKLAELLGGVKKCV